MAEARWREVFDQFDADGSGVISARELVNALEALMGDHDRAISAASDILQEADQDSDKKITWDEFKSAMEKA